jgi:hypothetical protein
MAKEGKPRGLGGFVLGGKDTPWSRHGQGGQAPWFGVFPGAQTLSRKDTHCGCTTVPAVPDTGHAGARDQTSTEARGISFLRSGGVKVQQQIWRRRRLRWRNELC